MLPRYDGIRKRIPEEPKWHDCHGVPYYDEFRPDDVPDIYADRAVLYLISCQACGKEFQVVAQEYSGNQFAPTRRCQRLETADDLLMLHFGDPPRHDCPGAGNSMNCWDLRVLQYWRRENFKWIRVPEMEIDLPDLHDEERER